MSAPEKRFNSLQRLIFIIALVSCSTIIWGITNNQLFTVALGVFGLFCTRALYNSYSNKLLIEKRKRDEEYLRQKRIEEENLFQLRKLQKEQYEEEMIAQGLQKVIHNRKEIWATPEQVREWKFIEVDLDNNFRKLSPHEFEKATADLFKKLTYEVELLPFIGDYGADLIVKKDDNIILVQCKKYGGKNRVGAPDVQRTLGSMHRYNANKAILVTTSDFTRQARIQASNAPIELWNKRKLREQYEIAYLKAPNVV
jgi:hypothetical protein